MIDNPNDPDHWRALADVTGDEGFEPPDYTPDAPANPDSGWRPALNPTQRLIFDDHASVILAYGEKGCLTLDTVVYTEDGLLRLSGFEPREAQPGFNAINRRVMTGPLTSSQADAYWIEADTTAIRAVMENGMEMTGSQRHPVWTCWQMPSGTHGFGWKQFSEMYELHHQGWRFWTPFIRHSQFIGGLEFDDDLAYAIGALVGDGSLNCGAGASVGFTNQDAECITRVERGLAKIGCVLSRTAKAIQFGVIPLNRIRPLLHELNIVGTAYTKRIPDKIIASKKSAVASFLRGLFDTDGTVEKNGCVGYCTTSEALGRDVQYVLAAFGILASRRPKKSASGNPTWTITIMGRHAWAFGQEIGFEISRKQQRIRSARPSFKNPAGFRTGYYGYPDPIRGVMKGIALSSRTDARKPHPDKIHRNREWHNRHRRFHSFGSVPARAKVDGFCELYRCRHLLGDFLLSDNWLELVEFGPTNAQLADLRVPGSHSFIGNGILNHNTGKSIGVGHSDIRHLYENNNALCIVIVTYISSGSEGIWYDFESLILPAWRDGNRYPEWLDGEPHPFSGELIDSGVGLHYTPTKLDPLTKDRHIWIANRHGGWSKLMLKSIPHGTFVEDRVKGPAPSRVHVEEITNCDGPEYYVYPAIQLDRRRGISGPQQYVATCNPTGPSHWAYKQFVEASVNEDGVKNPAVSVYHVPIAENLHRLPPTYIERLNQTLKDPYDRRRLMDGEWVDRPSGEAIFREYFIPEIHSRGDSVKGLGLLPLRGHPIIIGHDPGPKNYCITFLQRLPIEFKKKEKEEDQERPFIWTAFDGLNFVGEYRTYEFVARELVRRIRYWMDHKIVGFNYKFAHVFDEAAFTQRDKRGSFDVLDIKREMSKAGMEIKAVAAPKGGDSQPQRVKLICDLFLAEAMFVSEAMWWSGIMDMLLMLISQKIKEGDYDSYQGLRPQRSPHLHPFDSLSYPIWRYHVRPGTAPKQEDESPAKVFWAGRK